MTREALCCFGAELAQAMERVEESRPRWHRAAHHTCQAHRDDYIDALQTTSMQTMPSASCVSETGTGWRLPSPPESFWSHHPVWQMGLCFWTWLHGSFATEHLFLFKSSVVPITGLKTFLLLAAPCHVRCWNGISLPAPLRASGTDPQSADRGALYVSSSLKYPCGFGDGARQITLLCGAFSSPWELCGRNAVRTRGPWQPGRARGQP